jgi:hypothetical protein
VAVLEDRGIATTLEPRARCRPAASCGTGSFDRIVEDVFLPERRTVPQIGIPLIIE